MRVFLFAESDWIAHPLALASRVRKFGFAKPGESEHFVFVCVLSVSFITWCFVVYYLYYERDILLLSRQTRKNREI
jgi:hypothetical protein